MSVWSFVSVQYSQDLNNVLYWLPSLPSIKSPSKCCKAFWTLLSLHLCHCHITTSLWLHFPHLRSWLVFDLATQDIFFPLVFGLLLSFFFFFSSINFSKLEKLLNECTHEYLEFMLKILLVVWNVRQSQTITFRKKLTYRNRFFKIKNYIILTQHVWFTN